MTKQLDRQAQDVERWWCGVHADKAAHFVDALHLPVGRGLEGDRVVRVVEHRDEQIHAEDDHNHQVDPENEGRQRGRAWRGGELTGLKEAVQRPEREKEWPTGGKVERDRGALPRAQGARALCNLELGSLVKVGSEDGEGDRKA